jgi:hypothetical protein
MKSENMEYSLTITDTDLEMIHKKTNFNNPFSYMENLYSFMDDKIEMMLNKKVKTYKINYYHIIPGEKATEYYIDYEVIE